MNNTELQNILQKISNATGQSVTTIKAEIEKAILSAYVFPNKVAISIPRNGEIPTINEVLEYVCKEVEKSTNNKTSNR